MAKKPVKSITVGDKIRQMREKLKLDFGQLSQKTGFEIEYLKDLEDGKIAPPVGTLIQISTSACSRFRFIAF